MLKIFILCCFLLNIVSSYAARYTETSSHVYLIIPFHEMTQPERYGLIESSQRVLIDELNDFLPDSDLTSEALELLDQNSQDITHLISDLDHYVYENIRDHDPLQSIYSARDAIPSAFMFLVGGRFSVNFKLGGGGSATFALVTVPTKIIKINKITGEKLEYYALRCGIVVFPVLNIGGGIGGGASLRAGLGLVWGDLEDPEDFYGTTIGVSGSLAFGVGNNFKVGTLLGLTGIKNLYATATWQSGAVAELSAHLNVGVIVPVKEFIKTISAVTGEEENPKSVLQTN